MSNITNSKISAEQFSSLSRRINLLFDKLPSKAKIIRIFENLKSQSQNTNWKTTKKWSINEKIIFQWLVFQYSHFYDIEFQHFDQNHWEKIASYLPINRPVKQCQKYWNIIYKTNVYECPWSKQEDLSLLNIVREFQSKGLNNKWSKIADRLSELKVSQIFRMPKQCRERWGNKIDPDINRDPWLAEEDAELFYQILQNGKKWANIVKVMKKKRTEFVLKHRFQYLLKEFSQRKKIFRKLNDDEELQKMEQLKRKFKKDNLVCSSLEKALVGQIIEYIYIYETSEMQKQRKEVKFQEKMKKSCKFVSLLFLQELKINLSCCSLDLENFQPSLNLVIINRANNAIFPLPLKFLSHQMFELPVQNPIQQDLKTKQVQIFPQIPNFWPYGSYFLPHF